MAMTGFNHAAMRRLRLDRDLTIYQLSQLTGMARSTLYDLEDGKIQDPHMSTLRRLSQHLGCKVGELVR